jgi:two-component system, LytTR family, response regulator
LIKIVIIDDQEDSVEKLSFLLRKYVSDVVISGIANSGKEGVALINEHQPNIVFLDVEMEDMTGFEMLDRLDKVDFRVIFTTAYDKYAIQAIRFSALDYLLKPIGREDLLAAIERAKSQPFELKQQQVSDLAHIAKTKPATLERIGLTTSDGLMFKNIRDIVRCASDRNYTLVYMSNAEKLLVSKTLKEIDETLENSGFVRVHHSHLINIAHATQYVKSDGGYVVMSNGDNVSIARNRKDIFLEQFLKF